MNPALCPSIDELHAAAAGGEDLCADLESHTSTCAACRDTLAAIRRENQLAAELAAADARSRASSPTVVFGRDIARPQALAPGTRIDHFTIGEVLGEGGMGVVYRAEQDAPRRPVALKLIRPDLVTASVVRRFEHEAVALAMLRHPGIAQVYQAGVAGTDDAPLPYFAMELVEGRRLDHFARDIRPTRVELLNLFARICDAVDHAHRRGVIHRDLKPANILIESGEQDPAPKVLDFGVAKLRDPSSSVEATQAGGFVGTLAYAAPEQVGGDPSAIDARADVYALGVILYELLVGARPYSLDGSLAEAVRTITESRIIAPESRGVRLPADLRIIVYKVLAAAPERRYQSAALLADDVRRFLDNRPLLARADSTGYVLRKSIARHPYRAAAAAAFVLLAIGAAALVIQSRLAASEALAYKGDVLDALFDSLEQANQDEDNSPRVVTLDDFFDSTEQTIADRLADRPAARSELQYHLARASLSHRRLEQAARLLEHVVAERRLATPADPIALAAALNDLGRALYFQGDYSGAQVYLTEAHDLRLRALGELHNDTIQSSYWIAAALTGAKRYDLAEERFRDIVAQQRRLDPNSEKLAEYLAGLAAAVRGQGRFADALPIAEESLAQVERVNGPESKHAAVALSNIIANLTSLERYAEAEPLILRALAIREKWYAADDPRIADTLVQLASLKMRRAGFVGESSPSVPADQAALLEDAAALAQRSLVIRRQIHKGDHESVAEALSILGQVRMRQARYADALPALTAAMDMRTRLPRRNDGDLGRSESLLGDCLRRAGKAVDAEPLLRSGLNRVRAAYGDSHRHTRDAEKRLADLR